MDGPRFYRHGTSLINLNQVTRVEILTAGELAVYVAGDTLITIDRDRAEPFKKAIQKYMDPDSD